MHSPEALTARLAAAREEIDLPPGVVLAVIRLPMLDEVITDIERQLAIYPILDAGLKEEIERTVDVLTGPWIGAAGEAQGRRVRLVELLRSADGGQLPTRAFDPGDAFGADLGAMVATDAELGETLGALFPIVSNATSVTPSARWLKDTRAALARDALLAQRAPGAIRRLLTALVRADVSSRPDILAGGLRLANQRLARGFLWLAAIAIDQPAELLGAVGLRMGTSGRDDAVVRDTALANTSAALLGSSTDPAAVTELASMRTRVTNRNVLKQVDKAVEQQAQRLALTADDVVELSLPTFGLDDGRRIQSRYGDTVAVLELRDDLTVAKQWRLPDGGVSEAAPVWLATDNPSAVAELNATAAQLVSALVDERQRMHGRLASVRSWPAASWSARFLDHPIGGLFGRRLIWTVDSPVRGSHSFLPTDGDWLTSDGRRHPRVDGDVRLWHPAEAAPGETVAWREVLSSLSLVQPIEQVDREVFGPRGQDKGLAADRRLAGHLVDHRLLRSLLRRRGWAAPYVGGWDQGEEATAWRAFDQGIRAELRYQATERRPSGEHHEYVRIVAVRFIRAPGTAPAAPALEFSSVDLASVPPRVFSEALLDASHVVAAAQRS